MAKTAKTDRYIRTAYDNAIRLSRLTDIYVRYENYPGSPGTWVVGAWEATASASKWLGDYMNEDDARKAYGDLMDWIAQPEPTSLVFDFTTTAGLTVRPSRG